MGGNAFTNLNTPRLDPVQYNLARQAAISVLRGYFPVVQVPPEAPEKTDFGDVDVLVAGAGREVTVGDISNALKAVAHTTTKFPASFAVPLEGVDNAYAQIDIETSCAQLVPWLLWLKSYGDLTIVLGSLHRDLGLTISHTGLYLRIEELEKSSRKASMLKLTNNPAKAMEFQVVMPNGSEVLQLMRAGFILRHHLPYNLGGLDLCCGRTVIRLCSSAKRADDSDQEQDRHNGA